MRCDDFQIQVTVHKGQTEITPMAQTRVGNEWVDRPLTNTERFRVAFLNDEVLLTAIRDLCADSCELQRELCLNPDKIPEGTYLLDAGTVFALEEAIAGAWEADLLELLHEEPRLTGFPRIWELLRFLFCKKTREEQFDPSYHVLLADYLETRKEKYQTRWARQWLLFCFSIRTLGLLAQCSGTAWRVAIVSVLMAYGPSWLKDLLREVFQDQ